MKRTKIAALIIMLVLIINIIMPTAFALEEELNNTVNENDIGLIEENTTENVENKEENSLESEIINQENTINNEVVEEDEETEKIEDNEMEQEENINEKEDLNTIDNEEDNLKVEETEIEDINEELSANESFSVYVEINGYKIGTYLSNNIYYLFIPKGVDISNLSVKYTGTVTTVSSGTVDAQNKTITNDFAQTDTIVITANNIKYTIKVMQSDIPSICINLKNDVTLKTVQTGSRDTKYDATLKINGASDESYNISDDAIQFKGRGNTTWGMAKKGYQIKLNKKQNLLGIGNGKSKKWVLLANQGDRTLLRNKVMYDLGVETGLTNIPNSTFIDLYVNGEYLGNYLVSDKVESGDSRVKLTDKNGVLVELDNQYGKEEKFYFTTKSSGTVFALKESYAGDNDLGDNAEREALKSFETAANNLEQALNQKASWTTINSMIDAESFAKFYLVMEFSENPDGFWSSTFFYKNGNADKIHAGPVWDFDTALGYHKLESWGGNPETDYILKYKNTWYTQLFNYNEFAILVNKIYNNEIKNKLYSVNSKIDSNVASMQKSIKMNFARWNNLLGNTHENLATSPNGNTYESEVNYLKRWISRRAAYMDKQYDNNGIMYRSHVQDNGWEAYRRNGQLSGTEGQSKRLEAIKIFLPNESSSCHINYQVHIQDIGWQNWVKDGQLAGTEGQSKRLEGIKITLSGMPQYSVMYRVHVQDYGWQEWKKNGEFAGTEGQSKRLEAIEIKIVKTNYLGIASPSQTAKINYSAHIQDIGWSGWGCDSEMIGTEGISARLEGIKISVNNKVISNTNITYQVHVQDIGWQGWKKNGEFAGTEGRSLRLEAIRIKLDNSKYKVRYRTHIQDVGWRTMG